MKHFIENDEVSRITTSQYEEMSHKKQECKAVIAIGKNLCQDIGIKLYQPIILLENEEELYYESYESTGRLSFLFKYKNNCYQYLYQW